MKCPKCGYLGYERVKRCRNCGYDFVLTETAATPDLRLRDGESSPAPIEDLELVDAASRPAAAVRPADSAPESKTVVAEPALAELPLFGPPITDDVPLITRPSPPRPPLSVRRATPEVPRLRAEPRAPLLDWPAEPAIPPHAQVPLRAVPKPEPVASHPSREVDGSAAASLVSRAVAALVDVLLLAIVDIVVVYFTMKICRLDPSEWRFLPKAPLLAFLIVQNGGYLIAFTAVGQTLGKMMARIRVVADDDDRSPDVGRAALRALLWVPLALPAGLGLLSAALHDDRRGWHDRFAGTRVVSTRA